MNQPRNDRRRRSGFSLLEMTITAAIVGIVAAITIPTYASSLHRYRTQVAVQRLAQDIDLCRRQARFTSRNVTLTISFEKGSYRISPLDSPLRPGTPYEVALGKGAGQPTIHPVTVAELELGELQLKQIEAGNIIQVDLMEAELEKPEGTEKPASTDDMVIVFDRYGIPSQAADIGISCGGYLGVVSLSAEGVVSKP